MNEYLYYDEFLARQAELEQAMVREEAFREASRRARRDRRDRHTRRREATRRRRAQRRPWELPAGLVRPWPQ